MSGYSHIDVVPGFSFDNAKRVHLTFLQTDETTPNIVGSTKLGVVTSVLAVMCKRMEQLPATRNSMQQGVPTDATNVSTRL